MKEDERTVMTSKNGASSLELKNITTDDSGKYEISVENCYGADSRYSSVSVEGNLIKNALTELSSKENTCCHVLNNNSI